MYMNGIFANTLLYYCTLRVRLQNSEQKEWERAMRSAVQCDAHREGNAKACSENEKEAVRVWVSWVRDMQGGKGGRG